LIPRATNYSYDSASQLLKTSGAGQSDGTKSTYDNNGNPLTTSDDAGDPSPENNKLGSDDRLLQDRLYTYQYDKNGNLLERDIKPPLWIIGPQDPGFATYKQ